MNAICSIVTALIIYGFFYTVVTYSCYDQRYKSSRKKIFVILLCYHVTL